MSNILIGTVRLCLLGIGVLSLCWSVQFAPAFWKFAPLEGLASQIIRGENLSDALIEEHIPVMDALERSNACWPNAMHNAAIIRGRLVQIAIDNSDPKQSAAAQAALENMTRKSLACAPPDSFLWFAFFWVENLRHGFRDESIRFLEKSYELGPNEGWIALKRNSYALLFYSFLSPKLQQAVVEEFAGLVNSAFVDQAASNLAGPGWPIHDRLIASLTGVRKSYKIWLATKLRRAGIEVNVPGVDLGELRPWHVD